MADTIGSIFSNIVNTADKAAGQVENATKDILKSTSIVLGAVTGAVQSLASIVAPFTQIQNSAIELARSAGLAGQSIMAVSSRLIEQNRAMSLSMSYNVSSEDMLRIQQSLMTGLQRNVAIDMVGTVQRNAKGEVVNQNFDSELENLVAASRVFGPEKVAGIVAGFDKLGKSMNAAAKTTGKLFQEAGKYGINLTKYSQNFMDNLGMAQTYNFRNGVDGLREMARKATEIRQDMKQIASFADKVGSVTGSVETASRLQVLGGTFASLSNPLAMLNESLTNMEGLQDRFNRMSEGMAEYDSTTHQIRMSAFNRLRLKEAAQAMGVDPNNLIDQAYAQARQAEISRQMNGIGGINEDFKQMVKNMGEIDENGRAGVTIGGKFTTLSELSQMGTEEQEKLQNQLIEETRSESEDIKAIAKSVMGIQDFVEGRTKQAQNAAARNVIQPGIINGKSVYDTTLDTILNSFNDKTIRAGENLDMFKTSLQGAIKNLENKALAEVLINPFAENSVTDIGKSMGEGILNTFGDSELSRLATGFVENLATQIDPFVERMKKSFAEHGFNPFAGFDNNTEGIRGSEQPAEGIASTPTSVTEYFNKYWQAGFPEGGTQAYYPIVIPSEQYQSWLSNLMDSFKANQATMPTAQVMRTEGGTGTAAGTGAAGGTEPAQPTDYNFNFSGTFTFVGDNGKITDKDIDEIFRTHPEFANQIAHMIEEAIEGRR